MCTRNRRLGLGAGAALIALALAGTLGGCGLADGGITIVGTNPENVGVPRSASAVPAQNVATPQGTQTTAADTGAKAVGSATHGCKTSDLRLSITWATAGPGNADASTSTAAATAATRSSATSAQTLTLTYTNVSSATCTLSGYPSVDFVRPGDLGPLSEPDAFSSTSQSAPVRRIELAPGNAATASATFTTNGPGNPAGLQCDDTVRVRTFLPGSSTALTSSVHDPSGTATLTDFYVCGHGVTVSAFVAHPLTQNK